MATITFPTETAGDVTLDVNDIVDLWTAGAATIVSLAGGQFYRSPAPIEIFEVTLAQGGGALALDRVSLPLFRDMPPPPEAAD